MPDGGCRVIPHAFIEVLFDVPGYVSEGLADGTFVRRGGVIQVTSGPDQGRIVLWLRETPGLQKILEQTPVPHLPQLGTQLAALHSSIQTMMGLQIVSLGLCAVGFAVVSHQFDRIAGRIDRMLRELAGLKEDLAWLHRRMDYALLARVLAALEAAQRGPGVGRAGHVRRALETLTEATYQYRLLIDDVLAWTRHLRHPTILHHYEQQFLLAVVGKMQCHLMLGDVPAAQTALHAGHTQAISVLTRFIAPFRAFDQHFRDLLPLGPSEYRALSETRAGLQETVHRLHSASTELAFIRKAGIPYSKWAALGSNASEPVLALLRPRRPVLLDAS